MLGEKETKEFEELETGFTMDDIRHIDGKYINLNDMYGEDVVEAISGCALMMENDEGLFALITPEVLERVDIQIAEWEQ